jgi:hypothetical protein
MRLSLLIRGRKGLPSLRDRLTGNVYLWDRWPIASLSHDELVIADDAKTHRLVWKRAALNPEPPRKGSLSSRSPQALQDLVEQSNYRIPLI